VGCNVDGVPKVEQAERLVRPLCRYPSGRAILAGDLVMVGVIDQLAPLRRVAPVEFVAAVQSPSSRLGDPESRAQAKRRRLFDPQIERVAARARASAASEDDTAAWARVVTTATIARDTSRIISVGVIARLGRDNKGRKSS
jgi:hypothetical protein